MGAAAVAGLAVIVVAGTGTSSLQRLLFTPAAEHTQRAEPAHAGTMGGSGQEPVATGKHEPTPTPKHEPPPVAKQEPGPAARHEPSPTPHHEPSPTPHHEPDSTPTPSRWGGAGGAIAPPAPATQRACAAPADLKAS